MRAPAHLPANQAGVLEHLDVLRGRRERDCEGFRKLTDGSFTIGKCEKHFPPCGIAEDMENGSQLSIRFNHMVKYTAVISLKSTIWLNE